jgi:hypothetical protein
MKEISLEETSGNEGLNSLHQSAELLQTQNKTTKDLVLAIQKFVIGHAHSLSERFEPKSIIESRFTQATEAFQKGMTSCGAMANILAEMLRHIGFKVRLIHGECAESVDHAWISVYEPESDLWVEYDPTRKDGDVPATHQKKREVDSWEEIKDQIVADHETMTARRRVRGI